MNETTAPSRLALISGVLLQPRQTFQKLANSNDAGASKSSSWLLPMLVISASLLIMVLIQGWLQSQAFASGSMEMPPGFEYYTPEQQAQFTQSLQARQGPVFVYVIPALGQISRLWIIWLFTGGILHLVLTLLGGRGDTGSALDVVAWASLPIGVRALVQSAYMLVTNQQIQAAGLSGLFTDPQGVTLFASEALTQVDIYLIWQIILLIIGVRVFTGLARGKAILGVSGVVISMLLLQALLGYVFGSASQLTVVRPFMF